jgi:hypothetical protein
MAVDTAKKERWYHVTTDSRRVLSSSRSSVASVARNSPARNGARRGSFGLLP